VKATDPLVLPAGVVLRPAGAIDQSVRDLMDYDPREFVITRPGSRSRSLIVDAAAATLLAQFTRPRTIVDAVIAASRAMGSDPEQVLAEALPLISELRQRRLLVQAGSGDAKEIRPTLRSQASIGGLRVLDCVQVFEDVEVYHVVDPQGDHLALKILRPGGSPESGRAIDQEVGILSHLSGHAAPLLVDSGELEGRRYVVTSWCDGRDIDLVAGELRGLRGPAARRDLARLCVRVLRGYADLHSRSVIHADIHTRNIKIGADGSVTLLDFGLSSCSAPGRALPPLGRGGLAEYMEPEYCSAIRQSKPPPPATTQAEQYSLAALCFRLLAGSPYLRLDFERDVWMTQVITSPPRSFYECGALSWPAVEAVLAKALSKAPSGRFADVSGFAEGLHRALCARRGGGAARAHRDSFCDQLARRLRPGRGGLDGSGLMSPSGTVNDGVAGAAYFLYRLAGQADDPGYLTDADVWSSWARQAIGTGITAPAAERQGAVSASGPPSLLHGAAGVHCVDCLIRLAAGDVRSAATAARRFAAACDPPPGSPEVARGLAGLLLGCAALLEALPSDSTEESVAETRGMLQNKGDELVGAMRSAGWPSPCGPAESVLEGLALPGGPRLPGGLGFLHGRVGSAFAALRWLAHGSAAGGRAHEGGPEGGWVREELASLVEAAEGARQRPQASGSARLTGWCNGTAGEVLLWNLAACSFPEEGYDAHAEAAAAALWRARHQPNVSGSLCCGYSGQAYAFLSQYRRTRERRWLAKAEAMCGRAGGVASGLRRWGGLYKGEIGIALLAADLREPAGSGMPLIESEGW
jgi:eukaryotic-like serine/threonine-protein kinase